MEDPPESQHRTCSGPRAHSQASSGGVAGHRMAAQQPFPPLQQMHQQQPQQVQQPTRQLPAASLTDAWATRGSPRGSQKSDSSFTQSMVRRSPVSGMHAVNGLPVQLCAHAAGMLFQSQSDIQDLWPCAGGHDLHGGCATAAGAAAGGSGAGGVCRRPCTRRGLRRRPLPAPPRPPGDPSHHPPSFCLLTWFAVPLDHSVFSS